MQYFYFTENLYQVNLKFGKIRELEKTRQIPAAYLQMNIAEILFHGKSRTKLEILKNS